MTQAVTAVDQGYTYELANVDNGVQTLQFIKKAPRTPEDDTLETVIDGTTNEAVIEALIQRVRFLDEKFPSDFNKEAIGHLEGALLALQNRTADRESRGVEGKHEA